MTIRKLEIRGRNPKERMTGAMKAIEDLKPGETIEMANGPTVLSIRRGSNEQLYSSWTNESGRKESVLTAASHLAEYGAAGVIFYAGVSPAGPMTYEYEKQSEKPVVVYEAAADEEELRENARLVYHQAPRDRDDLSGRNWGSDRST